MENLYNNKGMIYVLSLKGATEITSVIVFGLKRRGVQAITVTIVALFWGYIFKVYHKSYSDSFNKQVL